MTATWIRLPASASTRAGSRRTCLRLSRIRGRRDSQLDTRETYPVGRDHHGRGGRRRPACDEADRQSPNDDDDHEHTDRTHDREQRREIEAARQPCSVVHDHGADRRARLLRAIDQLGGRDEQIEARCALFDQDRGLPPVTTCRQPSNARARHRQAETCRSGAPDRSPRRPAHRHENDGGRKPFSRASQRRPGSHSTRRAREQPLNDWCVRPHAHEAPVRVRLLRGSGASTFRSPAESGPPPRASVRAPTRARGPVARSLWRANAPNL